MWKLFLIPLNADTFERDSQLGYTDGKLLQQTSWPKSGLLNAVGLKELLGQQCVINFSTIFHAVVYMRLEL
jgi:hypothetical protein